MPVFFQQQINEHTRLGIWKIEETEEFFSQNVPVQQNVSHPKKRLQHLAGRFLLQFLFPDFPYELIQIADTRKPYLADAKYHFSISHCGDYAAAIVSRGSRVGIDIEIPVEKIRLIRWKFLQKEELQRFTQNDVEFDDHHLLTLLWSCKEAVFKWYGDGEVDFRQHIQLSNRQEETIDCFFGKNESKPIINYRIFGGLVLAWIVS